jgi:hypothetical protein
MARTHNILRSGTVGCFIESSVTGHSLRAYFPKDRTDPKTYGVRDAVFIGDLARLNFTEFE